MALEAIMERFKKSSPLTVMVRLVMQQALSREWMEEVFERNRGKQYTRELLFSTVVDLMGLVVVPAEDAHAQERALMGDAPSITRPPCHAPRWPTPWAGPDAYVEALKTANRHLVYTTTVSMPERMYILLSFQFGSASGSGDASTPTGQGNSFDIRYMRAWKFK
jgi:hypothetical protein